MSGDGRGPRCVRGECVRIESRGVEARAEEVNFAQVREIGGGADVDLPVDGSGFQFGAGDPSVTHGVREDAVFLGGVDPVADLDGFGRGDVEETAVVASRAGDDAARSGSELIGLS